MYRDDAMEQWRGGLIEWGPRILFAILILVATHFIAKGVEWAIGKAVRKIPALQRDPDLDGQSIGKDLGRLGYWLVWLVGLVVALEPLGLSEVLTPITALTNEVFAFIPNLIAAAVIFVVALIAAKIFRHVVEAALRALNVEGWAARAGLPLGEKPLAVDKEGETAEGVAPARHSIARAAGILAFAVVIIPGSIAALEALEITAISEPLTRMLEIFALSIPNILTALLWLVGGYVLGRLARSFIEAILPSFGFDRVIHSMGVVESSTRPSRIAGTIVFIGIMLFAAIEATAAVGGDSVAALLFQITELGGKVIFGTVIITVGIFLARLLARLVGEGAGEGGYAQTIVKYAVIALFTAIGLTFMGLANEIVILAFGLILGSAAIATALAFGLGGRDAAARMLEKWEVERRTPTPRPPEPKRLQGKTSDEDDGQPPLV